MEISELLIACTQNNASDLHLSSGNPPIMRIDGDVLPLNMPPLDAHTVKELVYSIMTEQQRSDYERNFEADFSLSFGADLRFRVNAFNSIHGPSAVMRVIPTEVITLEQINAPEILKSLCHYEKGLVLVTGPTGSGKSTTLAAMVDYINQNFSKHILTIEDPVEFVHTSKRSLINQREVGASTKSFQVALKSALREDPDVILVGEMRDLETIHLALTAAETGHLVFGTLHTNSAAKTIDRIIDVFPPEGKEMVRAMLSVSVQGIVAQRLFKRTNGGRIAAHEVLLGTPAIRNLIREGKIPQINSMMQMGSRMGMTCMPEVIHQLLADNHISDDTARAALNETDAEKE